MRVLWLLAFLSCLFVIHGQDLAGQMCSADAQIVDYEYDSAEYVMTLVMNAAERGNGEFGCGKLFPTFESMQFFEAAKYMIRELNGASPANSTFGLRILLSCQSSIKSFSFLQEMFPSSTSYPGYCSGAFPTKVNLGIIDLTSSVTGGSLLAEMAGRIPTVIASPLHSSIAYTDKTKYPTFVSTGDSIVYHAQAVTALVAELGWINIFVVYTNTEKRIEQYNQFLKYAESEGICVSHAIRLPAGGSEDDIQAALKSIGNHSYAGGYIMSDPSDGFAILSLAHQLPETSNLQWIVTDFEMLQLYTKNPQMRGILTVQTKRSIDNAFRSYFRSLTDNPQNVPSNPWYNDWYELVQDCSLAVIGSECSAYNKVDRLKTYPQLKAVKFLFNAINAFADSAQKVCPNGLCQDMVNMAPMEFYKAVTNSGHVDPETKFEIYHTELFGSTWPFVNIGQFYAKDSKDDGITAGLNMISAPVFYDSSRENRLASAPTSPCPAGGCHSCLLPPQSIPFHYEAGDLIIGILASAHYDGFLPLSCSKPSETKLATLVAAEYALQTFKREQGHKLKGVDLGILVADVCANPSIAQGFLKDLLNSGRLHDSSGATIPSKNIVSFVSDTSDSVAQAVSPILSQYMIPEIQVGATTSSVNSDMYQYFARAIPRDEMYAEAVAQFLQGQQWMHVQVLASMDDTYGHMTEVFKEVAARYGICVVQVVEISEDNEAIVNQLSAYTQSRIVIVFGDSKAMKKLLTKITNLGVTGKFQLVAGTRKWATDKSVIQGPAAEGLITIGLSYNEDVEFRNYLESLSLDDIRSNTFLAGLYEKTFDCALSTTTRPMYSSTCISINDALTPFQANAPYTIQAIIHIANQLHGLLQDICGVNYDGRCPAFRSDPDIKSKLYNRIVNNDHYFKGERIVEMSFFVVRSSLYQKLAKFDTENRILTDVQENFIPAAFKNPTTCSGFCVECQYLYSFKNTHMELGDWNLVGSFSISNPGPPSLQPYICGDPRLSDGAQYAMAMFYAIDKVNKGTAPVSVKGIKIGGLALDHCDNTGLPMLLASDMYAGFLNPQGFLQENVLAWLTDTSSSTIEAMEILEPLDVAVISPSATSVELSQYENFFATLQSDTIVSTALIRLARQLGFRYLQLVYADSAYGRDSKLNINQVAQAEGICISKNIEFSRSTNAADVVKQLVSSDSHVVVLYMESEDAKRIFDAVVNNADASNKLVILLPYIAVAPPPGHNLKYPPMSVQLKTFELDSYKGYFDSRPFENVFFAHYYMAIFKCNLDGYSMYSLACSSSLPPITTHPSFVNSIFELTTMNAVYAAVDALDRTVKQHCGQNYTQPCAAFLEAKDKRQQFNRNLNRVTFIDEGSNVFRFLEREGNVAYSIAQYDANTGKYSRQGTYAGVALNMDVSVLNTYANAKSECRSPCLKCSASLKFSLTEGDIYLGGVFDVHGPSTDLFTCGNIKTLHGYLLLEAFHFALEKVNSKEGQFKGILKNTKLGGVGLDSCSSQVRGGYLVSNVNNGEFTLSMGSVTVKPEEIDTYIGSYFSSATKYLARILDDLEIPQISYGATTTDLNDELRFPYMYRTKPSIDNQVVAMLKYLNEKNIRYVQIVYQGNNNGQSGQAEFVKIAADYNICVAQSVIFPDLGIVTREQSKKVVAAILENPAANTVVTFLDTEYINSVLRTIDVIQDAQNKFRFLGSEEWADNLEAIAAAERQAIDSVTLKLDVDDVKEFENFIDDKNLANNLNNPWFEEYFQRIHNCYTNMENKDTYRNPCPEAMTSIINSINYQQDPGVVHVINAVYAAAFAIDKSLKDSCGDDYTGVCHAYRSNPDRREAILENLATVKFTDPSNRLFQFDGRQPKIGYRFHALVPGRLGGVLYDQIGTYDSEKDDIELNEDYKPERPWNSGCNREDACAECPAIRYGGQRFMFAPSPVNLDENATTIVAMFDIHKQGVDPYRCGELNMAGFQQFLSFSHSIEQKLSDIVEGSRVLVIDTCSNPMRVDQDLFGLLQGTGLCNTEFNHQHRISHENIATVLISGEDNTEAAARVLEPFKITYVSPNAISTRLDNKMHLARTISPTSGISKFITEMISKMNWDFVDVLIQDSEAGFYPWQALNQHLSDAGICRGKSISITNGLSTPEVENVLRDLNGDSGAKVVVLLGDLSFQRRILGIAGNIGIASKYIWIIGTHLDITENFMRSVSPSFGELQVVSIKRISETDDSFSDYVRALRYEPGDKDRNNGNIPREWFEEFFQISNECRLMSAKKPINLGKPECNLTSAAQREVSDSNFKQNSYIMNTIAATYAVLHGADGLRDKLDTDEKRNHIRQRVLDTEWDLRDKYRFSGVSPLLLKFNDMRWWDSGFEVKLWSVSPNGLPQSKMWNLQAELTKGNAEDLRAEFNTSSTCQESPSEGYCGCPYVQAAVSALSLAPEDSEKPRNYYLYDNSGEKSYDWPVWAVVVGCLTTLGLVVTLILFLVLLIAYPKKGGASTLGYMVIIGIIAIYAINFAFFFHATDAVCGIRRFLMGVVYMITFAPLLVKAIDNWRFGHVNYSDRKYSGISSWWCMLMSALFVVLVQCIIPIMWLILEHPTAMEKMAENGRDDHWWCDPADDNDLSLVMSFSFVVFVILITSIFSALAYDTDTNNYESRYILFSCIVTAGCFLVWMIVTTNAGPQYRDPAIAISNFVNATLLLLIVPFRKAILMCQAKGDKYDESDDQDPYNLYQNAYGNEGFQLDDYDSQFVDSKPSEF